MAKLYRNATTDEYYTDTAMDGAFVTLQIHPEGGEFLLQEGVEEGGRISAEMFAVLEENGWLSAVDEGVHRNAEHAAAPVLNESETNAPPGDGPDPLIADAPGVRLEPRPWTEPENVERMRAETDRKAAGTEHSERKFSSTPADRANANPLTHGEDAAFMGNVWLWVLIVAAVVIVVWGLVEVF